jgi:hypothetical protein
MSVFMNELENSDDILVRQNLIENLEIGERAVVEGRIFTQEQAEQRLAKWLLKTKSDMLLKNLRV